VECVGKGIQEEVKNMGEKHKEDLREVGEDRKEEREKRRKMMG